MLMMGPETGTAHDCNILGRAIETTGEQRQNSRDEVMMKYEFSGKGFD
jgi:hypothetical protein